MREYQNEDGGFNISWKWNTLYAKEYEISRKFWRAKITIDKILFDKTISEKFVEISVD